MIGRLNSLRLKLTLWFILFLMMVFVGQSIFLYVNRRQVLYQKIDGEMSLAALKLINLWKEKEEHYEGKLDFDVSILERSVGLLVFNARGEIIFEHLVELKGNEGRPLKTAEVKKYLSQLVQEKIRKDAELTEPLVPPEDIRQLLKINRQDSEHSLRLLLVAAEAPEENNQEEVVEERRLSNYHPIYLMLYRSTFEADEELEKLIRVLLLSGFLSLLISAGGGYFLATRALQPINRLTASLEEITSSNFNLRVDRGAFDQELLPLVEQLNQTLKRLELAMQQEKRFTADASHELRTPLSALINQLEVLVRRPRTATEYQKSISEVLVLAKNLKEIVDDLLTLTRLQSGHGSLEFQLINLSQLTDEVWSWLRPEAEAKRIRFENNIDSSLFLKADLEKMKRIWTNLLKNAVEYNYEGGLISVETRWHGQEVTVSFCNTGRVPSPESLPHLFEPFFRDQHFYQGRGGAGLGLSIVKTLVELHGGRIEVETRPELSLITFRLIFPV